MIFPPLEPGRPQEPEGTGQVVHAENGFAYGAVGADIHVFGDGMPLYLLENWRPAPQTDPEFLRELPSRMLNARFAVVDFTGRQEELADLRRWRQDGPRLAARWLQAPGGQGKTRLAAQFAQASLAGGWKVITATHGPGTVLPPPGSQDLRLYGAAGLLLVVDYADRWPLTHLTWLFSNALLHQSAVRTRILMLARSGDPWPAIRAVLANHQAGTSTQLPPALPDGDDGAGERLEMFTAARDSFAARYGTPANGISPPGPLEHPDFGLTLAVHIAALVAVDAQTAGRRPPRDLADLTIYLLDREHLHWERLYGDPSHQLNPTERSYATPPGVMNQAVFTAVLTGPVTRPAGTAVLETLRLSTPAERVVADHTVCYPPAHVTQGTVLEPLYPDRLAEDFLALTLPGHSADYPAQLWARHTTTALLARSGDGAPAQWIPRAITFLTVAAARWPHLGPTHLYPLLRADPQLAVIAGGTVLTALAGFDDVDPVLLGAVEAYFPDGHRADLNIGMAHLTERLAKFRLRRTDDLAARAAIHYNLGVRMLHAGLYQRGLDAAEKAVAGHRSLAKNDPAYESRLVKSLHVLSEFQALLGHRRKALAVAEEGIVIRRRLAERNPVAHKPDLGQQLISLGQRLSALGRLHEALAASQEAVVLYRRLAKGDPAAYEIDLGSSLIELGNRLSASDRRHEALAAAQEAVSLYRRLTKADPATHEPNLAAALGSLGIHLQELGQREIALHASLDALAVHRRLAKVNPAVYEPALATSLHNLSKDFLEVGRREESLLATQEAVAVRRRLTVGNRAAHAPALANSLMNLGTHLSEVGRQQEAVVVTREAVAIRHGLAFDYPAIHDLDLADALHNLGFHLLGIGERAEAVTATQEAVAIRRRLAEADSATHGPALADTLHNLGVHLKEAGRTAEALAATREAVELRRRLAEANPTDHEQDLGHSLHNLGILLRRLNSLEEAITAAGEAVAIRRRLAAADPTAYEPDLAQALRNLSAYLSEANRLPKDMPAAKEAVRLRRRLAEANPTDREFAHALTRSLFELGVRLSEAGWWQEEAVTVTEEAVAIRRRLAEAEPTAHEPDLAQALHILGDQLRKVGQPQKAHAAYKEAVETRRRLAHSEPVVYETLLAHSLHDLGAMSVVMGRPEEAMSAIEEAVAIRRRLAQAVPARFEPDLAFSLVGLGNVYGAMAQFVEARAAAEEAVAIRRRLAAAGPAHFEPGLAALLSTLGCDLARAERYEDALAVSQKAVEAYRRLAEYDPATDSDLALSLHDLGSWLWQAGRLEDAVTAAEEAVAIRRRLAEAHPASHQHHLAAAMNNLAAFQRGPVWQVEILAAEQESEEDSNGLERPPEQPSSRRKPN